MPSEPMPPLTHRIGGPWLLSTPLIAFTCAAFLLSIYAGEPSATASGGEALRWLAVWAGSAIVYVAYALVLRRICRGRFARDGFVPVAGAVAIALGALLLFSATINTGAAAFGLPVRLSLLARTAINVPFGLWFGFGVVLLLDAIARSQGERRRLVERRTDIALGELQQDLLITGLRDVQWREVERQLAAPRRALLERLEGGDTAVAAGLRELADGSVRDVSARLMAQAERELPRIGLRDVVRGIVRTEPLHPWVMAAVIVLGTATSSVAAFGWRTGVALVAASAAFATIAMLAGNAAMRRPPDRHAAIFLVVVAVLLLGLAPTRAVREELLPGSATPSWLAVQAVSIVFTVLLISGVGAWVRGGRALRRAYLVEVDERQVRAAVRARAVTAAAHDVARALHGTVQTKLIATAIAGEQAIASGDRTALERALEEARSVLEDLGAAERPVGAIADEVAFKAALWKGLCDIRLRVGELAGARADAEGVGRVVEEGIANAVRHGGATRVEVAVRAVLDGSVEVVVEDDGTGLASVVTGTGTGSAILDAVTGGAWERSSGERGCRLTARVPALAT